jgi:hypothetical protein
VFNSPTNYSDPFGLWGTIILPGRGGIWVRPPHSVRQPTKPVSPELARPRWKPDRIPEEQPFPPEPPDIGVQPPRSLPPRPAKTPFGKELMCKICIDFLGPGVKSGVVPPVLGPQPGGGRKDPPAPPPCVEDMMGGRHCVA